MNARPPALFAGTATTLRAATNLSNEYGGDGPAIPTLDETNLISS